MDIPKTLYKYVRRDGLRLLEEKRLRVPSPIGFNDPFEVLPGFEALVPADRLDALVSRVLDENGVDEFYDESARERGVSSREIREAIPPEEILSRLRESGLSGIADEAAAGIYRVVQRAIGERLGIVCFTDKPDSLLMWGHYAEGHRGFAFGFDPRHPFFQSGDGFDAPRLFRKVDYARRRPRIPLADVTDPAELFSERLAHEFFFTKSEEWAYESEWRLVVPLDPGSEEEDARYVKLPRGLLTTVILGSRTSAENRDRVLELVSRDEDLRNVEILRAVVSDEEFRIELEPVDRE